MRWEFHTFDSLDTTSLFALMKLRVDVFVVEQACAYAELDDQDTMPTTIHLLGYRHDALVAYARAMPPMPPDQPLVKPSPPMELAEPAGSHREPQPPVLSCPVRIGRVLVAHNHRGEGIATALMQQMLGHLAHHYPLHTQALAAQEAVRSFYESLGFLAVSDEYLEDGIPHIDMVRR